MKGRYICAVNERLTGELIWHDNDWPAGEKAWGRAIPLLPTFVIPFNIISKAFLPNQGKRSLKFPPQQAHFPMVYFSRKIIFIEIGAFSFTKVR
ncbi:hypothetical protein [Bacillus sp. KH172YL63]|uniref:hypothetical protein n=1 Tax=Bacillus sp. KH172YL63 TaxID=2709784 RepID=UPI001566C4CB|nr:hypothetical protein [Bacillus sp. KH172YL63]